MSKRGENGDPNICYIWNIFGTFFGQFFDGFERQIGKFLQIFAF